MAWSYSCCDFWASHGFTGAGLATSFGGEGFSIMAGGGEIGGSIGEFFSELIGLMSEDSLLEVRSTTWAGLLDSSSLTFF